MQAVGEGGPEGGGQSQGDEQAAQDGRDWTRRTGHGRALGTRGQPVGFSLRVYPHLISP